VKTVAPARRKGRTPAITLSEDDGVRYLHFGTEWVQGGMRIARPWALELEYQRQMMAVALFVPQPRRIVQLGLGAAALTKFCYRYLPASEIQVIEVSTEVISAARAWFHLPEDNERLHVVAADAREAIGDPRARGRADWLQVDLYDAAARGPVYDSVDFYRACRRALRTPGIACFNLFGRSFDLSFGAISTAFDARAMVLPEVDAGNRVALAVVGPPIDVSFAWLYGQAKKLEADWGLPARRWVSGLRSENGFAGRLTL
jgi:spermidine synthase